MKKMTHYLFVIFVMVIAVFTGSLALAQETAYFQKLVPLHESKKDYGAAGWMATQPEDQQTFSDFTKTSLPMPDKNHPCIYIVLLGDFDEVSKKILDMTSRYMQVYFQMPVKFLDPIPLASVPAEARRVHPQTGDPQILTTYVIERILVSMRPKDAYCLIAFTPSDLWPGKGWNFVFGQASMTDRVGVWSIYRNGDPKKSKEDFKLCLRRTMQTGTHELGHMFGLAHCIYYECNMNGSNSRKESDARPLWECPVCLRKLTWAIKFDPVVRYRQLAAMAKEFGLTAEANFFEKSQQWLTK